MLPELGQLLLGARVGAEAQALHTNDLGLPWLPADPLCLARGDTVFFIGSKPQPSEPQRGLSVKGSLQRFLPFEIPQSHRFFYERG